MTDGDVRDLEAPFGRHRALDLIRHIARGNYMTRFADALQLPLEPTNVFKKPEKAAEPTKP